MAEFRRDTLTGRWVLLSPERLKRPVPPVPAAVLPKKPFKANLVASYPVVGRRDAVEVHRHLYPAVAPFAQRWPGRPARGRGTVAGEGTTFMLRFASGQDLVDVDGPRRAAFADAVAHCLTDARTDPRVASAVIFRNHGPRAGATLAEPHHQFWAVPVPSPEQQCELEWARTLWRCPTCSLLSDASNARTFVVARRGSAVLLARPAARFGAELMIAPTRHVRSFVDLSDGARADVVALIALGVRRVRKQYGDVGVNEVWREFVVRDRVLHTRIELLPRLNAIAGLELGSGLYLNPYQPEKVAKTLRGLRTVRERA